jgi:hypothetical protein
VSLAAIHFEHILHASDDRRLSLPSTRGQGRGNPDVWRRIFIQTLKGLQLPCDVIQTAEQRLRPSNNDNVNISTANNDNNNNNNGRAPSVSSLSLTMDPSASSTSTRPTITDDDDSDGEYNDNDDHDE